MLDKVRIKITSNVRKTEQGIEQKISSNTRTHRIKVLGDSNERNMQFKSIRTQGAAEVYLDGNKTFW